MAWKVSPTELNCLQINTKHIPTLTFCEGRNDNSERCDEYHVQHWWKVYLYFFQVFWLTTRPKPVGYDYVFSMAVGTIGKLLKLIPFLLADEQ